MFDCVVCYYLIEHITFYYLIEHITFYYLIEHITFYYLIEHITFYYLLEHITFYYLIEHIPLFVITDFRYVICNVIIILRNFGYFQLPPRRKLIGTVVNKNVDILFIAHGAFLEYSSPRTLKVISMESWNSG